MAAHLWRWITASARGAGPSIYVGMPGELVSTDAAGCGGGGVVLDFNPVAYSFLAECADEAGGDVLAGPTGGAGEVFPRRGLGKGSGEGLLL